VKVHHFCSDSEIYSLRHRVWHGSGNGGNGNECMGMGREWEYNDKIYGNVNGNKIMGMGGNPNSKCYSHTPLTYSRPTRSLFRKGTYGRTLVCS